MVRTHQGFSFQTIFYIILLIAIAVFGTYLVSDKNALEAVTSSSAIPMVLREKREAMFEIVNYRPKDSASPTISMYFNYRYKRDIPDEEIPNYLDIRNTVTTYIDAYDMSDKPYWDTVSKNLCIVLRNSYPLDAITCQISLSDGVSAVTTLGEIAPLRVTN